MFPPSQGSRVDIEALSGICGSISIACWVVVFSPQIIENFRRGSADGLSLLFIVVWLAGDVFNILGAVLQGVLPTMVILAVYYTLADIVLLGQCFYYRGFTLSDASTKDVRPIFEDAATTDHAVSDENENESDNESETAPLMTRSQEIGGYASIQRKRRASGSSFRERLLSVDGTHLSPATPLIEPPKPTELAPATSSVRSTSSRFQAFAFNAFSIVLVCGAGAFGWWISSKSGRRSSIGDEPSAQPSGSISFDFWGQVFGYLCAALYLGSRVPQILLNWRRKSTEGVSLLFFLFACIGNLTYVLSIFAYSPVCVEEQHQQYQQCTSREAARIYGRYILVNLSWILGSLGTLVLDLVIFCQFFLYMEPDDQSDNYEEFDPSAST